MFCFTVRLQRRLGLSPRSPSLRVASQRLQYGYHLMSIRKKLPPDNPSRLSFPWILWHLWKARNSLCFKQVQYDGSSIFNKASEESTIWLNAQLKPHDSSHVFGRDDGVTLKWQKPSMGIVKCNIASS